MHHDPGDQALQIERSNILSRVARRLVGTSATTVRMRSARLAILRFPNTQNSIVRDYASLVHDTEAHRRYSQKHTDAIHRSRANIKNYAPRGSEGISRQFRPDYRSERHKLIIEFDGDQHYRSARHVIEDGARDQALTGAGYRVIRIPYFVQMTEPVIGQLLGGLITGVLSTSDMASLPRL